MGGPALRENKSLSHDTYVTLLALTHHQTTSTAELRKYGDSYKTRTDDSMHIEESNTGVLNQARDLCLELSK